MEHEYSQRKINKSGIPRRSREMMNRFVIENISLLSDEELIDMYNKLHRK